MGSYGTRLGSWGRFLDSGNLHRCCFVVVTKYRTAAPIVISDLQLTRSASSWFCGRNTFHTYSAGSFFVIISLYSRLCLIRWSPGSRAPTSFLLVDNIWRWLRSRGNFIDDQSDNITFPLGRQCTPLSHFSSFCFTCSVICKSQFSFFWSIFSNYSVSF